MLLQALPALWTMIGPVSVFLLLIGSPSVDSGNSALRFCDRADRHLYQSTSSFCTYGFMFGERVPTCACFAGIFNLYYAEAEDCARRALFGNGLCLRLRNMDSEYGPLRALQILPEPDWSQTHVVYKNSYAGKLETWEIATLPPTGTWTVKINVYDFYVLRGKPYLINDHTTKETTICVQRKTFTSSKKFICEYTRSQNNQKWPTTLVNEDIPVVLTNGKCSDMRPKKGDFFELDAGGRGCNGLLDGLDEDACLLGCEDKPPHFLEVCTDATEAEKYNNEYLDRQMTTHALRIQLYESEPIQLAQPNCTFDLFMRMVGLTRGFCDNNYVSNTWVRYMTELFYVLHKGREFQYVDDMSENDCLWIRDILDTCTAMNYSIVMSSGGGKPGSDCATDHIGGKAWGYCEASDKDCLKPIEIKPIDEKQIGRLHSKHYVPQLAWDILDATQAICFHEFRSSYRMFHILQQAIEKLFTPDIRNLWYNPVYKDNNLKKTRLVGPSSDEHMHNMEICIGSAYHQTNAGHKKWKGEKDVTHIPRLVRPPKPTYLKRKKRQIPDTPPKNKRDSIVKQLDVYCANKLSEFSLPDSCITKRTKRAESSGERKMGFPINFN